jgi:hypothetical protein
MNPFGMSVTKSIIVSLFIVSLFIVSIVWAGSDDFHPGVQSGSAVHNPANNENFQSFENNQSQKTSNQKTISVPNIQAESKQIFSNKSVSSNLCVGDISNSVSSQAFLSFDISQIPEGSTIEAVKIDLRNSSVVDEPFSTGCMRGYQVYYDTLSATDFFSGMPMDELVKICALKDLRNSQNSYPKLAEALQNSLGLSRFQLRLQFVRLETAYVGLLDFGQQGEGWSMDKSEVVGESSGEWKPCLPKDTTSRRSATGANKKGFLRFDAKWLKSLFLLIHGRKV